MAESSSGGMGSLRRRAEQRGKIFEITLLQTRA